ncbi:MAG: single-stranded-DNA-specific exonuclease RecJ [Clostridiales bacterium GWF2_38_85]|nr:MAG: single-stranded-DNA-specific exonuclease RecJ [Clostridiales bacterium GWF2_38_85]HBL83892.1 single-stranded-DNA-specific exonuclease RecJ [Clostridiales bacterium]
MTKRQWILKEYNKGKAEKLEKELGILPITAKLLCIRGITEPEQARAFLYGNNPEFYDPFLLADMQKAVDRIKLAKEHGERVCVYGDYDVDGVTSTTVLYKYLRSCGIRCGYFIPERITDGYGLNPDAIERLSKEYSLIITVDTGVTAIDEVEYAKKLGVDILITDHHSCREFLPDAVAVVNPQRKDCSYPFKCLAGVGVVFKLISALEGNSDRVCDEYGDLIALGTISDVMPLINENRQIVKVGIKKLANTDNLGLAALMRCSGVIRQGKPSRTINSSIVGFVLAPRINAAGRIAKALYAVELLLADTIQRADEIAEKLCEINKQRQETELEIYKEALRQLEIQKEKGNKIYVFSSDNWHQGVIGVVASKISDKYEVPSILFSYEGDIAKGSARSIKGFNIMDALTSCEDLLLEYGGHELAAGISIRRQDFDEFSERINEYAKDKIIENAVSRFEIDCECSFNDVSLTSISEISKLEPFGLQNPLPLFMMRNMFIQSVAPVGNNMHVKLRIIPADCDKNDNLRSLTAMCFGATYEKFPYCAGDICDIVFGMDQNEYNGVISAQMLVKDVRLCEENGQKQKQQEILYHRRFEEQIECIPTLEEFREIYRYLKRSAADDKLHMNILMQSRHIVFQKSTIGSFKLRVMLDVLEEQQLVECQYDNEQLFVKIKILPFSGKINLDNSKILGEIKKRSTGGSCERH